MSDIDWYVFKRKVLPEGWYLTAAFGVFGLNDPHLTFPRTVGWASLNKGTLHEQNDDDEWVLLFQVDDASDIYENMRRLTPHMIELAKRVNSRDIYQHAHDG